MTVTITDLFCGAGGSSLGAQAAGGELVMAANHWPTAIDVHQAHFPDAAHDLADISQVDPRRYPRTDILLASPECTNHSAARGVSRRRQDPGLWDAPDPSAERSRSTMWDVVRFAEQMHYDAVVVENVVEAARWVLWPAWRQAMEALGYELTLLSHNSQDHSVPQSRDRLYCVWARNGLTINLTLERTAWCGRCDSARAVRQAWKNGRTVGRYGPQWVWACTTCGERCEPGTEPAASIIDWDLRCPRIGERARPLAPATRARIAAGLARYGWAEPVTTSGAGNGFERTPGNRARPVTGPVATQTCTAATALAEPPGFLFNPAHGGRARDLDRPHPTVYASDDRQALVVPLRRHGTALPAEAAPVPAVTASGQHHGLLMRNNTARGDQGQMVTPVSEPARTLTAKGHQSLLVPYHRTGKARPVTGPAPTVTTRDRAGLVVDVDRVIDDCGFRMLEPYEVAAAMAFPDRYIPRTLTKRDQVRLAGNAVTPPVMAWIVGRVVQALKEAS